MRVGAFRAKRFARIGRLRCALEDHVYHKEEGHDDHQQNPECPDERLSTAYAKDRHHRVAIARSPRERRNPETPKVHSLRA